MKIAFIIPSLIKTGPVIMLRNLISGLKEYGCEMDVYYFDAIDNGLEMGCRSEKISYDTPIDFDSYDIVHSHCFRADRYTAKWKNRCNGPKFVSTLHQNTYRDNKYEKSAIVAYLLNKVWLWIHKKFDTVVCISNQLHNHYRPLLKNVNIEMIHNGVDIAIKSNEAKDQSIKGQIRELKAQGFHIIATYAHIVKRKGIDQIIKVLPDLKDFALVVIGDGPYKSRLKNLAVKNEVEQRVLFINHIDNPYLYLDDVDIYCMPSYSEGFGLAMVESALQGKPIVCSDISTFHEIFSKDEARFFKLNDKENLKKALTSAYDDKETLSLRSKNRVKEEFTYKVMAQKYLELYRKISGNEKTL